MFRSSTSSSYILFATTIFRPTMLILIFDSVENRCTDSHRIPESEKVLLQVGSGIHHILLWNSETWAWNSEYSSRNPESH